jgi:2-isopropylmalate synthase
VTHASLGVPVRETGRRSTGAFGLIPVGVPMTRARLTLYDTTLRDGQQTQGVQFSTPDPHRRGARRPRDRLYRRRLARGEPHRQRVFRRGPETRATMTAFGMTKRAGRSADNDEVLAGVMNAGTAAVCLVGKTHDFHVTEALGITLDENVENIAASVAHLVAKGREALFDAEHFFDGYKANPGLRAHLPQGRAGRRRALDRAL